MEPQPCKFNFTSVDELVKQARAHRIYLVLLWFGTWKNGRMHYVPEWVKTDTQQFPRVIDARRDRLDVLSPNAESTLAADKKAFAALMQHVKQVEGENHPILLGHATNESGTTG